MYIVVFINSWHFYQIFLFFFFFSWKLECWISFACPPTLHLSWKCPFLIPPGYRKTARISQLWTAGQWLRGTLVKASQHVAKMYPERPPHSWADHPALHVFPQSVSDPAVCALTCVLFFIHLQEFFMLFSMWFHSVTWQRARGGCGKDQYKLFSSHLPLT